ncbi:MAG: hypothetical protein ACM3ST_02060 [Bdellovibrio bacteriovorus]
MVGQLSLPRTPVITLGLLLALLAPSASAEIIQGHNGYISYDTEAKEYWLPTLAESIPAYSVELSASTALCAVCHEDAIAQLKGSVHFSVQAPNPRILFPGGGAHGALDRACGLPGTTALINYNSDINLGECGKCHVGRFIPPMEGAFTSIFSQMGLPDPAGQAAAIVNGGLDCMICHAEKYLSVRDDLSEAELATLTIAGYAEPGEPSPSSHGYAKLSRDNTDFDHDGEYDPLIDITGDGVPDMCLPVGFDDQGNPICGWPTVAQDRSPEAVLSVGKTDEHNCLRCHEHARTGYKRGTLFRVGYDAHANLCFPDPSLTADDPNCPEHNTCTACHVTLDSDDDGDGIKEKDVHKFVRGHLVGGDMAAADYPPPPPGVAADPSDPTHLTCEQCHKTSGPNGLKGAVHSPRHLEKIACETCHITQSAGITYSMYGHGGHVSFGRNAEGRDTKVITADHLVADEDQPGDVDADFAAYRLTPVLMWFNGSTSFLAQSLAIRGAPNAKITPFKPMANGMVMDGRFFKGEMIPNQAMVPYPGSSLGPYMYNAHSMYRFYANAMECDDLQLPDPKMCSPDGLYGNADAFTALKLLGTITDKDGNVIVKGLTPEETRKVTLMDLQDTSDPNKQTMAFMQAFPNLMNFSKSDYKYEHYLVSTQLAGSSEDLDGDGIIDPKAPFLFDMLSAVNAGLEQFKGFNVPMFLPPSYDWYPKMESVSDVATMKLPDGSDMKMLLAMQLQQAGLDMEQIQQLIGSYPAFSNGVTLGGHGVTPDPSNNALGGKGFRKGCQECHGAGGVLENPVPVTEKVVVDLPFPEPMNIGEMPAYVWTYYNVRGLIDLGLKTENENVVAGKADIDIADDKRYVRTSRQKMIVNWLAPASLPTFKGVPLAGYADFEPADSKANLKAAALKPKDLTWNGGPWMPVLEPVTAPVPNYAVLGYRRDEVIFSTDPGPGDDGTGKGRGKND